jgi:hypothetical protein
VAPCSRLGFEVLHAVCLGAVDAGLLHGGFPARPLLSGRFQVCQSLAFGGFSAEGHFLCDLCELVFQWVIGGVGSFGGSVGIAAAEDEAQAVGGVVVEAGDADPGVLVGLGDFLLGGGVFTSVLFLQDEETDCLPLGGNGEVGWGASE